MAPWLLCHGETREKAPRTGRLFSSRCRPLQEAPPRQEPEVGPTSARMAGTHFYALRQNPHRRANGRVTIQTIQLRSWLQPRCQSAVCNGFPDSRGSRSTPYGQRYSLMPPKAANAAFLWSTSIRVKPDWRSSSNWNVSGIGVSSFSIYPNTCAAYSSPPNSRR